MTEKEAVVSSLSGRSYEVPAVKSDEGELDNEDWGEEMPPWIDCLSTIKFDSVDPDDDDSLAQENGDDMFDALRVNESHSPPQTISLGKASTDAQQPRQDRCRYHTAVYAVYRTVA